jgi:hypothetical protein
VYENYRKLAKVERNKTIVTDMREVKGKKLLEVNTED